MSNLVTNINVFPVTNAKAPNLRANVYFNTGLLNVKASIVEGQNGLFVSLPGGRWGKNKDGKKQWFDDVKTTDKEATAALNKAVLAAYEAKVGSSPSPAGEDDIPF